ncbi:MAG: hypothetical protein JO300_11985 [Silvibacterium sp.]|nr:hypothetical protein [Silvibacterium sp.]MBV8437456.1 hypothetical protein [Silvibacterium sp.]
MRRLSLFAAAMAVMSATPLPAQTAASCPATPTLSDLVKAVDDAVSGAGNKDRTCLRQILTPDARLIPVVKGQDGKWAPHVLTVDDYVARVAKRGDQVFYERQIKYSVEEYGHIAHLWSTYEVRDTPDGKATVRGINSMQAVYDGTQWKLIEILWQAETPDQPLPAKFLP